MVATVLSIEGTLDAIRFGEIGFSDGGQRFWFLADLLSGGVRVYRVGRDGGAYAPETDPRRVEAARAAIVERLATVEPAKVRAVGSAA